MITFSPRILCLSQRESRSQRMAFLASPMKVLFKAIYSITVVVRPHNTSNEQQIHISTFSTSLLLLFFLFHKHHLCQLPRDSAFLISVSEITPSAFGISLWVDDLFFSPPGASIRHAGPGPEPKPGREAEPRRWHTDRQSDLLVGRELCPGHHHLVQDTGQIEEHTEGERCVKVRHDSDTHAACSGI